MPSGLDDHQRTALAEAVAAGGQNVHLVRQAVLGQFFLKGLNHAADAVGLATGPGTDGDARPFRIAPALEFLAQSGKVIGALNSPHV